MTEADTGHGGAWVSPRFDWTAQNANHVARHGVGTFEVEEAMTDPGRIGFDVHDRDKKGIVGRTEAGRPLFVVYVVRDRAYHIITARDLTPGEKRIFRKRRHE